MVRSYGVMKNITYDCRISSHTCREKNIYIHFGEEALGKAYLKIVYCLCGGEDNPTVGYENGGIFVNNLYKIII